MTLTLTLHHVPLRRHRLSGDQAETQQQRHLSELISQQEVELHAAKIASDRAAKAQSFHKQELAEALAQVADLTQQVTELSRCMWLPSFSAELNSCWVLSHLFLAIVCWPP